ncbi:hypothetical protein F5984_11050 [Rudanella paleaurantiibacter]|uniref:Uncharacterized protein n=1 Tax=Rudanella paleaurantiibacter TaxID=2614655 RepID=A0A7J5U0Q2_9BACT|nr:hypothetical protein F5984_11050 [Rudanella paleaurantiibacter]
MPVHKTTQHLPPLVIRGRNATGKIIEGIIPAGERPAEDPGLAIQKILAKRKNITPTPILPE